MTKQIAQTTLREKKKLLSQESKTAYQALKGTLSTSGYHTLFAEPILTSDQKSMLWFTDLQGDVKPFADLSAEDKAQARHILGEQIEKIYQLSKQYENESLRELIQTALIIPNEEAIFIIYQDNQLHVVLTQWGYIQDTPNANTDILRKFIEIPRYILVFIVQYEDGTALPAISFKTILKGILDKVCTTDTQGSFAVEVSEGKELFIEEIKKRYKNSFLATKSKNIVITLPYPTEDMRFEIWDTNDVLIPNSIWEFNYAGQTISHTSDNHGCIILPRVWFGTAIKVYQNKEGKEVYLQSYMSTEGQDVSIVRLPTIPKRDMLFRVLKQNKPIVEALLTLQYIDTETQQEKIIPTNESGEYIWTQVPLDIKVKAVATKKINKRTLKTEAVFLHTKENDTYILRFKNYRWSWWFMLLLLPFIPMPISLDIEVVDTYKRRPIIQPATTLVSVNFDDIKKEQKNTNNKGMANFGYRWMFLFEFVLPLQKIESKIICDCFEKKEKKASLWYIPKKYELSLQTIDTTFEVLTNDEGKPVPQAKVQITIVYQDIYKEIRNMETDKYGKVHFDKIPSCAKIILSASKKGYKTDTLRGMVKELKEYRLKLCHVSKFDKMLSMLFIEEGNFMMGNNKGDADEKPVHKVTVNGFYLNSIEVTQELWEAVMDRNPSIHKNCLTCPVENVSWIDVEMFLEKLNETTCSNYRLPTEAEWEYAARGGNKSKNYLYAGSNNEDEVVWYDENSGEQTHPVAQKKPNELGLYDMSGNVQEWTHDWYAVYDNQKQTKYIAVRSGSYTETVKTNRITQRNKSHFKSCLHPYLGFRIARNK